MRAHLMLNYKSITSDEKFVVKVSLKYSVSFMQGRELQSNFYFFDLERIEEIRPAFY